MSVSSLGESASGDWWVAERSGERLGEKSEKSSGQSEVILSMQRGRFSRK